MAISDMIYNPDQDIVAISHTSDTCEVGIHLHDNYEVFMALSDNIRYYVEGRTYDLRIGDIILTNQKEIHRPMTTDDGAYGRAFVQFKPHLFQSLLTEGYNPLKIFEDRALGTQNLIPKGGLWQKEIEATLASLVRFSEPTSPKNNLMMKSLLIQLFIYLYDSRLESAMETPTSTLPPRVSDILAYLDDHYTEHVTLDALAGVFYMDKYYMTTLFRTTLGFTIIEYIQSKRIQSAKALIAGGVPITEVSHQCGYEDYSNFYKTFKKLTKMSPKAYKALIGEG